MRIVPGVYQIGGSFAGLTWTGDFGGYDDANVFAVESGDGLILFDAGNGETSDQILANMTVESLDPAQIRACFLTHAHWDHAAGAFLWRERFGAALYAGHETAEALEAADERCAGFLYHRPCTTCHCDTALADGQIVSLGGLAIEALHLPGHTDGCTAYRFEYGGKRIIVTGDVIGTLSAGWFGWDGSVDFDKKRYINSLRRFAALDFDIMLTGHGPVCFGRPRVRVESALERALALWR